MSMYRMRIRHRSLYIYIQVCSQFDVNLPKIKDREHHEGTSESLEWGFRVA